MPAALVALYAWALHWIYATQVAPDFDYMGYHYEDPDPLTAVVTVAIAIGVAYALPRFMDRASSIVLWVLYTVAVAPSILMAPYTSYVSDATAIQVGLAIGAVYAIVALAQSPRPKPLTIRVSARTLWIVLALLSVLTYSLLHVAYGLRLSFLPVLDVYDVRAEFADELRGVAALGYLVTTQANVVNPLIAALGAVRRNWGLVFVAIAAQLVLYSTTGYKHILFSILAWAVMVAVLRVRGEATRGSLLLWGATGVMLVSALVDTLLSTNLATSLFSRRFILTPGLFTSVYVSFFSENPKANLGYSVLAPVVDYPYEANPPQIIGEWLAGKPGMSANANLFADGFANFGLVGVVGAGAILLVYLRVLDRASAGLPIALVAVVVVIPAVALSNSSILTSMLSHGLVAALVLLALVNRPAPSALFPGSMTRSRVSLDTMSTIRRGRAAKGSS